MEWVTNLISGIGDSISEAFTNLWDTISTSIWDLFLQWIYEAIYGAIGDFFTKSDWSAMVKWPFWILLFSIAAGGVYCARFGKKTLVNQSVCSTLTLVTIYLGAALLYLHVPSLRTAFSELPFLVVTDNSVALLDPFSMDPTLLPQVLLRLMIVVFLVTAADSFRAGGKLLACGNGGSAADCDHIVGELMKGFLLKRKVDDKS